MNIKKSIKNKENEQGQALLFVVVALTIALAVGVGVSVRTLSSISRTSRTDTASRVLAAAEGGAERFLVLTREELDDALKHTSGSGGGCPVEVNNYITAATGYCNVAFDKQSNDNISAEAHVTVSNYSSNVDGNGLYFRLAPGAVKEVVLDNSVENLNICWRSIEGSLARSDIYYIVYGTTSRGVITILDKKGVNGNGNLSQASIDSGYTTSSTFDSATSPSGKCPSGYSSAYSINFGRSYGIRLKALNEVSDVVVTSDNTLPTQGYKIVSKGVLKDQSNTSNTVATKVVTVYKSLPYLSALFDFGMISGDSIYTRDISGRIFQPF